MRRWGSVVGASAVIACASGSACASIVSLDTVDPADGGTTTTSKSSGGSAPKSSGSTTTSSGSSGSTTPSTGGTTSSTSSTGGVDSDAGGSSGTPDSGPAPTDPQVTCAMTSDCSVNQTNKLCRQDFKCVDSCVAEDQQFACNPAPGGHDCCVGLHCVVQGQFPNVQDVCVKN